MQTSIAYKTANEGLINNLDYELIKQNCKRNSRFAGSMRNNLVEMLDELKLNYKLNIDSCSELFGEKDYLLHTTSMIPYPVFINNKNYTGYNPKIMENGTLYSYVKKYFYNEMKQLPNALIIPLGKAVEEVLYQIFNIVDGAVVSAYEGIKKPDPKIFKILLEKYSLVAGECLLIDDDDTNKTLEVANDIGIKGRRVNANDSNDVKRLLIENNIKF